MHPANAVQAFVDRMLGITVSIIRNAASFPDNVDAASGFLVPRESDFRIITASHQFADPGGWTLETGLHGKHGTLHLALRELQFVAEVDLATETIAPVDIAWADVLRQDAEEALRALEAPRTLELPVYQGPLDSKIVTDEVYGFAAYTQGVFLEDLGVYERSPCYEVGMQVLKRDEASGVVEFSLVRKHQGHAYYKGASGAPIADSSGRIAAIVLGGHVERGVIYGMELERFAPMIAPAG